MMQLFGEQQSVLDAQTSPRGRQVIGGAQIPPRHMFGGQQSALAMHMPPAGVHGGRQRPPWQVVGAQQSPSDVHAPPTGGQGCQRRYDIATSSPTTGRYVVPKKITALATES